MAKGFYYIECSVDEYHSRPVAFFETLAEAKEGIKKFADWYRPNGTGNIMFQSFDKPGVNHQTAHSPVFICRGDGLDKEGNVIWKLKRY